mmetsp:Transcript_686/g.847  ORF Transcript_686/g.847 Transcript_686/m.847 type:complete len:589 (+) Transcript_686:51-1817(+)
MNELDQDGIARLKVENTSDEKITLQVLNVQRNTSKNNWDGEVLDGSGAKHKVKFARQLEPKLESEELNQFALIQVLTWTNPSLIATIIVNLEVLKSGNQVGGPLIVQQIESIPTSASKTPATKGGSPNIVTKTPIQRLQNKKVLSISQLNPYNNKWTIKVRLTTKGEVIQWTNARGSGELMKVTFTDADGDDIEAIMFKEAVRKWEPILQENNIYLVSGGRLKVANRQYCHTSSKYEITLDASAAIEQTSEDGSIGKVSFQFVTIAEIFENIPENASIDLIAVLKSYEEVREVISSKLGGKTLYKRDLILLDESKIEITLTLWGDLARKQPQDSGTILAFKRVKVSDYNGKSLSILRSSKVFQDTSQDPALQDRAQRLHTWYHHEGGAQAETTSIASTVSKMNPEQQVAAFYTQSRDSLLKVRINDTNIGQGPKPDYLSFKATIINIKTEKLWYEACPTCQRKVIDQNDGTYACEKCNATLAECERRFLLSFSVADDTASQWISAFNDAAISIFAITANELCATYEESEAQFTDIIESKKYQQLLLRCRCKQETWQDQTRLKITSVAAAPLDFYRESQAILDDIKTLL